MKNVITNPSRPTLAWAAWRLVTLTTVVGLLATGTTNLSAGGNSNRRIAPINSKPHGKTYSEWASAWWQWAVAIPADESPLLDDTGADADLNQSGPVWFLAGNSGGVTERSITVPVGKSLFFPILNQIYLGFPCDDRNLPGCEADQALEEANDIPTLLSFIDPGMDGAALTCEIDGVAVKNPECYRVRSSAIYSVTMPEDNIYAGWGLPGGPYHPCVDVGYYLMLRPLPPGRHTIRFTGATADAGFSLDVTYHITVKRPGRGHGCDND